MTQNDHIGLTPEDHEQIKQYLQKPGYARKFEDLIGAGKGESSDSSASNASPERQR